jgi:hypothetical protein
LERQVYGPKNNNVEITLWGRVGGVSRTNVKITLTTRFGQAVLRAMSLGVGGNCTKYACDVGAALKMNPSPTHPREGSAV